jgi:hypothetical protein
MPDNLIPSDEMLAACANAIKDVPGDIAELGILRGDTFLRLLNISMEQRRRAWAIDSFAGMGEPTAEDANDDGTQTYPAGRFSGFSVHELDKKIADNVDLSRGTLRYEVVAGFVPGVLDIIPNFPLAFAYIDLDHCDPTRHAAAWCDARLSVGGVLLFDDWFPGKNHLASKAIREFINAHPNYSPILAEHRQVAIRKDA